jgi:hypothetical protein
MKKITHNFTFLLFLFSLSIPIHAQVVTIPDANFKNELVTNLAINTNGDAEIQLSEAQFFSGTIDVKAKQISSLVGIQAFTALQHLDCAFNHLTSLNISPISGLVSLDCNHNSLTTLDVSTNTSLTSLNCGSNQLTSLDVSTNVALLNLVCGENQQGIDSLDLSNNILLTSLSCTFSKISYLNVTTNNALVSLTCQYNDLTALNLSNNPSLLFLSCGNNLLSFLDVSQNTSLERLYCQVNQLTNLDLSNHHDLNQLVCNGNQLSSLNIRNGNNVNLYMLHTQGNPNLFCIEVDDVAYSTLVWIPNAPPIGMANFIVSSTSSYSTNCVVNTNNKDILTEEVEWSVYPNPIVNQINIDLKKLHEKFSVDIINSLGQVVFSKYYYSQKKITLDLDGPNGIYWVKIKTKFTQSTIRITKNNSFY